MALPPFFVRPLPFSLVGASNQLATNPAAHLAELQYQGMVWRTTSITGTNAHVVCDLGSLQTVDYFALLGTNALPGTTIELQMDNTNTTLIGASPTYRSNPQTLITPAVSGRAAYHWHWEFTQQSRRYFALIIANHTGAFEATFAVIGRRVPSSRYYETDWETAPEDLSQFGLGRNGVPEIATGAMLRRIAFTLGWMTEAEYETAFMPLLLQLGRVNPVFLSFDPEATVYRQARTYFGQMRDLSPVVKRGWSRFEKKFELLSKI